MQTIAAHVQKTIDAGEGLDPITDEASMYQEELCQISADELKNGQGN